MRWMVIGAAGMLGQDLVTLLDGADVQALDRNDLDLVDAGAVGARVRDVDVVVNCAAYTAVDAAEEDESTAFAVNAVGAANLARASARAGARVVQISTDYVFDGTADQPYAPDAPVAPRSAYGRTKAAGEWAVRAENPDHLVVRTAWLYGAGGPSFPRTIARLAAERDRLDVVADQIGQPTWTRDLADYVVRLVQDEAPSGTWHGTAGGSCSWFDLAQEVVTSAGLDPAILHRTTTEAFPRPAPRPAWSVLSHEGSPVTPIGHWRDRWHLAADDVLAAQRSG